MQVSEAALKLDVPRHYIDYWRRTGLLSEQGGTLEFQDLRKIQFIAGARSRGISLQKIRSTILEGAPVDSGAEGQDAWYRDLLVQSGQILKRAPGQEIYLPDTGQYFFNYEGGDEPGRLVDLTGARETDGSTSVLERRFEAALQKGDVDAMEAVLDEILEQEPDHLGALIERGNIAFENDDYERAVHFYEMALTLDEYCVEAIYNLANIYFRQKKNAVAIRYFLQCIELDPEFPESYYNLGIVYYSLNILDRARVCFETYIGLDPDSSWTAQAGDFLEEIEGASAAGRVQGTLFGLEANRTAGETETEAERIPDLFVEGVEQMTDIEDVPAVERTTAPDLEPG